MEQLQGAGMETAKLTTILRQTNEHTKAAVEASLEGNAGKALEALDRGGGRVVEIASREARFAQIAEDYAALSTEERQKTLVIEPSREGRDALTQDIRNKLIERGQLGAEALKATKFVSRDLTKAEATRAESYEAGDIVRFAKDYAYKGVSRHGAYRVIQADEARNMLTLQDERGREFTWRPRQWGAALAQVYREEALELRVGDRVFANAESSATHLLEQKSFYVALSRARAESVIYTDDRSKLQVGLQERVGMSACAINGRSPDIPLAKDKRQGKAQEASLAL